MQKVRPLLSRREEKDPSPPESGGIIRHPEGLARGEIFEVSRDNFSPPSCILLANREQLEDASPLQTAQKKGASRPFLSFATTRIATVPKPITADSLADQREHLNYLPIFRQNGGVFFNLRGTRHTALYRGERRSAPPYNENEWFYTVEKRAANKGAKP